MGIPGFFAPVVGGVEFFGGILVLVGLFARLAALALAVEMIVAILVVHLPNGFFMAPRPGIEYPLVLAALALTIVLAGPGVVAALKPAPSPRWRQAFA